MTVTSKAEVPIVCFISTYKEGQLVQGAIRSALACTNRILVFEGLTETEGVEGEPTQLGIYNKYLAGTGRWDSESEKRNAMLQHARQKWQKDFWIMILDADELLVWGENLRDWLNQLNPGLHGPENVVPLKITEHILKDNGTWDTWEAPHRLYHSSIIIRYVVGSWQFEAPGGKLGVLNSQPSDLPPIYGEPHIHHRHYLRRGERQAFRAHEHEEARWKKANMIGDGLATDQK